MNTVKSSSSSSSGSLAALASEGEGAGPDFMNSSSSLAIFASASGEGGAAANVNAGENRSRSRPGIKERILGRSECLYILRFSRDVARAHRTRGSIGNDRRNSDIHNHDRVHLAINKCIRCIVKRSKKMGLCSKPVRLRNKFGLRLIFTPGQATLHILRSYAKQYRFNNLPFSPALSYRI